jgi:tRNA-2-methylthio-N6-dimethylallyladenosine synthase
MSAADGEELSAPLHRRGWSHVAEPEQADAIVLSTCTVRQHAEDRALSLIGSLKPWKEADSRRLLIVAGCAAERLGPWLSKRFPHVDLVVGAKSIGDYPRILEEALGGHFNAFAEDTAAFGERAFRPTGSAATGYVTIMRGCNYSCSYCIVPEVRGRELYRPADEIAEEAARKCAGGVRELMLLGQTVNSHPEFGQLLRRLDKTPGLSRLRFMSPHPYYADDEMLAAMAECSTVCEQLHLPVQSGSNRLLKLMKRNYTRESFLALTKKASHLALSTDVIVGFPTETEEDFALTLSLVEAMNPVSAYTFKYSPREGTASAEQLPDDVPAEVKEERLARLNALVDRMTENSMLSLMGQTVEVLAEQPDFGRTRSGHKVRWEGAVPVGALARVRIVSTTRRTLKGELHG